MAQAITSKALTDKRDWEEFISTRPEANFLHSWNWGQFHQNLGKKVQRLGFYRDAKLSGVMLSIVEQAKRATYLTVPGGPLIDWADKALVQAFRNSLEKIARETDCSFARVRPQILETEKNSQLFAALGFRRAPMHLHAELTHQLDLSQSEASLMKHMRKTTRYEIRKGKRLGIKVKAGKNPEEIRAFYELQLKTARRQGFIPFSYEFLYEQFKAFVKDNQVRLYTASYQGEILSQAFIIFYGREADYHYSASSELNRKYPGSYSLLWRAIRDAQKGGFGRFNLWGVAPQGKSRHRFYGLSVFKRGFRGQDVAYLHARDLVVNRLSYCLNLIVEKARKHLRKV